MKRLLSSFVVAILLLCMVGCQNANEPPLGSKEPTVAETPETIPILYCDFADKNISLGEWDTASNEFVVSEDLPIGTSEDPYTLYSIRWDGDRTISGLQAYLDELNHFEEGITLKQKNYGEFVRDQVSVSVSDDGEIIFKDGDTQKTVSGTEITIDGIGEVTPAMLSGVALSLSEKTAYYLQSIMSENGVYLVCSEIDRTSMHANSYILNDAPYSYEEIDVENFGEDAFAENNGTIYFYTKNAIISLDTGTRQVSQVLTLNDLNLPSNDPNVRYQISGIAAYKENIIVECSEYVTDIPNSKTSFLCSPTGEVIQSIRWECSEELVVFPKQ